MPRKTTGCWTCRARKKKCDDGRPACAACMLRGIACFGYGAKPAWLDGGDRERSMLLSMKQRAKESYGQRRRMRALRAGRRATPAQPPAAAAHSTSPPPGAQPQGRPDRGRRASSTGPSPSSTHASPRHGAHGPPAAAASDASYPHGLRHFQDVPSAAYYRPQPQPLLPPPRPRACPQAAFPYSETELSMLMYYFDHVFPRLAPFFVYSAGDKGRGWLLSLFLRTRPLCAAAVCISACDQAQFVLGPLSDIPQPNHDLEMKHIHIVSDLRAHLAQLAQQTGASRMPAAVEALACIMHLVLFELWIPRKGGETDWVTHLDAASALLSSVDSTMAEAAASTPSSASSAASVLATPPADGPYAAPASTALRRRPDTGRIHSGPDHDRPIERIFPVQSLSDCERSAFDFFLSHYTCFFVFSAVGYGLSPQATESLYRTHAIFHAHQTKLRDILGIEDWVMMTLLDIAALKAWKQSERRAGTLSLRELSRRAEGIEARISEGLLRLAATAPPPPPPPPPARRRQGDDNEDDGPRPSRSEKIHMITTIFLNAALLFLHTVVSGCYPKLPEIRRAVLQTLEALEHMRAHCDINIPSWPYCVAGCLALESQYPRFRALSPPPKPGRHPLVLTKWTLQIIERCWQMRAAQRAEEEETVDWVMAMNDLGTRLLLL